MRADGLHAQSVLQTAQRLKRPEFNRHRIAVAVEPRARDRRQRAMDRFAHARALANRRGAVSDADVVAHTLDAAMRLVVDPWEALEFRIKLGPLFERTRLFQSHLDGMPKIRRTRIGCVDIAVEF